MNRFDYLQGLVKDRLILPTRGDVVVCTSKFQYVSSQGQLWVFVVGSLARITNVLDTEIYLRPNGDMSPLHSTQMPLWLFMQRFK